ncbi:MAG: diacylglycerol kinase family lipid kinase [Actinomycetota bacterium]|nr:diacylglycerol kinase family lipid kinase [Actinomycetota bacterium]
MTSVYGPMVLICNAHAGHGGVGKALPKVRALLEERELDYEVRYTQAAGDATTIARTALDQGFRFLVAVGGDGTVHEVVNGMIEDDKPVRDDAVMGVVAAGTGSDFIKTFGLPAEMPAHAVAHLDGGEAFPIDIGKIVYTEDGRPTVRYFANVAEAGLGAEAVWRAGRLPRWFGPMKYFVAFWLAVRGFKGVNAKADLVDRTYEGRLNNLVVANGQYFGGGMKIAPRAAPTDGLLDIQIEHARKREAISLLPKVYKGEHVPHEDIFEAKRVKLSIETDRPLRIEADGEVLGYTPATFEIIRDAIRLKV